MMATLLLPILMIIFYLPMIGLSVACMVYFIRLGNKGMKALDIYIQNNGGNS